MCLLKEALKNGNEEELVEIVVVVVYRYIYIYIHIYCTSYDSRRGTTVFIVE